MAKIRIDTYTFDASAQTITFTGYGSISLDGVLIVANVTDGIIIFNFADSTKVGSVSTNVLTLDFDTTSMSDSDDLLIYYDDPAVTTDTSDIATQTTLAALLTELQLKANLSETQPVSAASLPLPSGAATAANQLPDGHNVTVDNASIAITAASLPLPSGAATQTTLSALLAELATKTEPTDTQPISAASLPLPTGAATESTLSSVNTSLNDIETVIEATGTAAQEIQGQAAHSAVDSGNPLKIGGKGYNLEPVSSATAPGPTNVSANDRTNLMTGLKGELTEHPLSIRHTLSNVNTTYNNVTTSATSQDIDSFAYRYATVGFSLTESGTATNIAINVEVSHDGTNFFRLMNGALGAWLYDDTTISGGIDRALTFRVCAREIRVNVVATGTTASNTFTMSNAYMHLCN